VDDGQRTVLSIHRLWSVVRGPIRKEAKMKSIIRINTIFWNEDPLLPHPLGKSATRS
jgi:hypothetical protein